MSLTYPVAYTTLAAPRWTLEQCAEAAVANGYAALELRFLDGALIPSDLPADGRQRVRDILRRYNLACVAVDGSTRFGFDDADARRARRRS